MNLRRLTHVQRSTDNVNNAGALVALDIEKAFNTLGWSYLWEVLNRMGFGPKFLSWIKLLYDRPAARVRLGTALSKVIPIERGIRQGCPLSPLLFALAMEPLAIRLREVLSEQGIKIGDVMHIISLYADDALVYVKDPRTAITILMDTMEEFGKASGLLVNKSKTILFPLGSGTGIMETGDESVGLTWERHHFRYLGMQIASSPPSQI